MIMIGPGTGSAPFRGFLQERAALKQRGVPVGESLLFFGCRDPQQDFLYEDELRAFEALGHHAACTARSRARPGQPKIYVQQAIREQADEVWRLLQQEAVIFVCGDASRMAPGRPAGASSVATLRAVWRGHSGEADGFLRPEPVPPIVVGGFGPKMAALAGAVGDGVNLPSGPRLPALLDVARSSHAEAGGDPARFLVTVSAPPNPAALAHLEDLGVHRAVVFVGPPLEQAVSTARLSSRPDEQKRGPDCPLWSGYGCRIRLSFTGR